MRKSARRVIVTDKAVSGDAKVAGDTHDLVLQVEQPGGGFLCRAYSGVPSGRRSYICIVSSGSEAGRAQARDLGAELDAVLLGSGPGAAAADIACDPPERFDAAGHKGWRKLLVLVGSGDQKFTDHAWYRDWSSDEDDARLMVVLPSGEYSRHFDATIGDEHPVRAVNAAFWSGRIAEVMPAVLARAEVTAAASRVFISYRRVETLPIALQLFDRLVHEGFDVFLDRFSIEPGYDFQRRLSQELQDKSMVVLLESKGLRKSKWTQHEIDFAKRHRLGLLSLRMPDVPAQERLPVDRLDLDRDADLTAPPIRRKVEDEEVDEWQRLVKAAEDRAVARIKQAHADALFRRRHRLRADLVAELTKQGVQAIYRAVGPLTVGSSGHEHLLWLTTRPAEVEDFRSIHGAHHARTLPTPDSRFMIIGPQAALEPDRVKRLQWLRDVTSCLLFDEGNLPDVARRVAQSDWR